MPSNKDNKTVPAGSLAVTLIGSSDWSKNAQLVQKVKRTSKVFESGSFYTCNECYGGNTVNLLYPFLHLSKDTRIAPRQTNNTTVKGNSTNLPNEWFEQAAYIELDQVSSRGATNADLTKAAHVIFIGLRIGEKTTSRIVETSWRKWSKVGILTSELLRSGISIANISFMRQIAPRGLAPFTYCFLVALQLTSAVDQLRCLNVLQKLRGSTVPGYVSLFQLTKADDKILSRRSESQESFDQLLTNLEQDNKRRDSSRRKSKRRSVNTV